MKALALALGLALITGCSGPRTLETRLESRRTETYQAEAEKIDGLWRVSLRLPVGAWTVEADEVQAFEILPGDPAATLRWRVTSERWLQQDKPLVFRLRGAGDFVLHMSVTYPPMVKGLPRFLLEVLANSRVHLS